MTDKMPTDAELAQHAVDNAQEQLGSDIEKLEQEFDTELPKVKTTLSDDALRERYRHIEGMRLALKNRGINRNSSCPCKSGKKFKKCCLPLMDNVSVPWGYVKERMGMIAEDEFQARSIQNAMMKEYGIL